MRRVLVGTTAINMQNFQNNWPSTIAKDITNGQFRDDLGHFFICTVQQTELHVFKLVTYIDVD